jgi:hypothetical protein
MFRILLPANEAGVPTYDNDYEEEEEKLDDLSVQ